MDKISFFKLPLTLTLIFWLLGCMFSIGMAAITHPEAIDLFKYIIDIVFNSLFYGMPKLLLLMLISSFALYRCYVHQATVKNMVCLGIIALIIFVIIRLYNQFIGSIILSYFFNNFYYYDQYSMFFVYQFINNIVSYIIISLVAYYGIFSLQNVFDRTLNTKVITLNNSAKIHVGLFLLSFMFIYMIFLVPLSSYVSYSYSDLYDYRFLVSIFYLIAIMIVVSILYLLIRNCFNCAFAILQVSHIIKSSILAFVLSTIVNAIISAGMIFMIIIIAFGSYYRNESTIIFVILVAIALQLLFTSLITRSICKRYFSTTFNESTL